MNNQKIRSEFIPILNRLIEFTNQRRHWYQDQFVRISDQQLQHISIITSIAAAILAIIVGYAKERNFWIESAFWSLVLNVALGFILIQWAILFNRKVLKEERIQELSILDSLKEAARLVVSNPSTSTRNEYIKLASQKAKKIEDEPEKHKLTSLTLNILYYLFLLSFLVGTLSLIGIWQKWDILILLTTWRCIIE